MRILHGSMSAGTKRTLLLSLALTVVSALLPISSHATVDWTEGFEYANAAAMNSVWTSSFPGCNELQPSTTRFFSGSKSLKETFTGHDVSSCYMDRALAGAGDTLYSRYYMYMDNFTVDSVSTKMTLAGEECCYPSFWWVMMFGSPTLDVAVQGIILDNGTLDTQTVYGGPIPQNQWVCIETHVTMSSPGVDNGIVQAWINGAQVINVSNLRMRAATLNQKNSPSAAFRFVRLYTQNGMGTIYYDNYAVSRDTRIGCSGSVPTNDITPPSAPAGLFIR